MKERPILFSGPMVRAILEGRKTQTRQVVKLRDPSGTYSAFGDDGWPESADKAGEWYRDPCPYGVPGDRLYVRENLRWERGASDVIHGVEMHDPATLLYEADDSPVLGGDGGEYEAFGRRCRRDVVPSIHMPRWASRITLEVTGIRVERVQAISEADAVAEGCGIDVGLDDPYAARKEFTNVWDAINGRESWNANPWVWVVEFKRVEVKHG